MPSAAAAVRKTVTVLFCDLAGSTELGERLDPEALRTLMGRWYAAMRDPVERHGGTVEKFVGDAVLAVFGVPQLHEDDALRAVRAAVEMRTGLARLNAEYEARHGFRFVVFVNRRPKREILDVLHGRIARTTDEELETALGELVAIAEDRWRHR